MIAKIATALHTTAIRASSSLMFIPSSDSQFPGLSKPMDPTGFLSGYQLSGDFR
jgi:hypothetical protein